MPALIGLITDAGQTLLGSGPLPVVITKVAIGSGTWVPTSAATALNTLIKEFVVTDSDDIADNIIHVVVTDESTDTYSCREVGLYAGTTLFAIYAQSTPIFSKAADAIGLFAADIPFTSLPPGSVTVGAAGFANPQATEVLKGVAEIATSAEASAGTDDARIITPLKLKQLLNLFALLDSPAFTGNPTAPTQAAGNNTTRLATTAFVQAAINAVINAAPGALNTLDELAAALGDDANFAATMTNALAGKANGAGMTFLWSGLGGQPNWLWGGNDGVNMRVYNPANFSVATCFDSVSPGNLYSQRALGTTYTNTTGKTLYVCVTTHSTSGSRSLNGIVNTAPVARADAVINSSTANLAFVVPPGATYAVVAPSGFMGIFDWYEM